MDRPRCRHRPVPPGGTAAVAGQWRRPYPTESLRRLGGSPYGCSRGSEPGSSELRFQRGGFAPALLSVDLLLLCPQNRDVRIIANATEDEDVWPEDYDNDATTLKPMRSVDPAFPSQDEVAEAVAAARDAIVADDAMCSNGDARSVVTEHLKGTFPTYQSWGLDIPPDLLRAMTNEVRSRHIALIDTLSAELVDEFIEQVTPRWRRASPSRNSSPGPSFCSQPGLPATA